MVETLHGVTLTDRYRWLEDGKDPGGRVVEPRASMRRRSRTSTATRRRFAGMRDEIARNYDRDRTYPPFFKHGREFFQRAKQGRAAGEALHADRWPRGAARRSDRDRSFRQDEDRERRSESRSDAAPRSASTRAARRSRISAIIDTTTGAQIGPLVTGVRSFSWARDEAFAFVSPRTPESDARQEPHRCYRHKLGADRATDELLIKMDDAKDWCQVYEPEDAPVTVFETGDFWSNTIRIRPVGSTAEPRTIYTSDKFQADAIFRKDRLYVRTNRDAPNWKLMAASYANPEFADWTTLIPEGATVLDQAAVTRTGIVVRDREDVLARLTLYGLDGRRRARARAAGLRQHLEPRLRPRYRHVYAGLASHTVPPSDVRARRRGVRMEAGLAGRCAARHVGFVSKRVYVTAKDGAKIPVFIVHRKDLKQDGANPTLLAGYGGFNIAVEPYYMGGWYPFISRGGVFVDAGVRGGSEYGETWHEQAMFARKQNTFDDMVAVAEWLVAEKYTQPAKLAVEGGSNGGLTVGALLTQRPDLFRAAICQVPLLDMVRYHKFLIARYWIAEYGDPTARRISAGSSATRRTRTCEPA